MSENWKNEVRILQGEINRLKRRQASMATTAAREQRRMSESMAKVLKIAKSNEAKVESSVTKMQKWMKKIQNNNRELERLTGKLDTLTTRMAAWFHKEACFKVMHQKYHRGINTKLGRLHRDLKALKQQLNKKGLISSSSSSDDDDDDEQEDKEEEDKEEDKEEEDDGFKEMAEDRAGHTSVGKCPVIEGWRCPRFTTGMFRKMAMDDDFEYEEQQEQEQEEEQEEEQAPKEGKILDIPRPTKWKMSGKGSGFVVHLHIVPLRSVVEMAVHETTLLGDFKLMVSMQVQVPPTDLRLVFQNKTMTEELMALIDYGVVRGSTIYMLLKYRGG